MNEKEFRSIIEKLCKGDKSKEVLIKKWNLTTMRRTATIKKTW